MVEYVLVFPAPALATKLVLMSSIGQAELGRRCLRPRYVSSLCSGALPNERPENRAWRTPTCKSVLVPHIQEPGVVLEGALGAGVPLLEGRVPLDEYGLQVRISLRLSEDWKRTRRVNQRFADVCLASACRLPSSPLFSKLNRSWRRDTETMLKEDAATANKQNTSTTIKRAHHAIWRPPPPYPRRKSCYTKGPRIKAPRPPPNKHAVAPRLRALSNERPNAKRAPVRAPVRARARACAARARPPTPSAHPSHPFRNSPDKALGGLQAGQMGPKSVDGNLAGGDGQPMPIRAVKSNSDGRVASDGAKQIGISI